MWKNKLQFLSRQIPNSDGTGFMLQPGVSVDWEVINEIPEEIDLSVPLLAVQNGDDFMVIDGYHRIAKASQMGVKELPCVVLNAEASTRIQL